MGFPQLKRGCCCCILEAFGYFIGYFNIFLSAIAIVIIFFTFSGERVAEAMGGMSAQYENPAKFGLFIISLPT